MLGTLEEVVECVKSADVLKPSQEAAVQLLALMSGEEERRERFITNAFLCILNLAQYMAYYNTLPT